MGRAMSETQRITAKEIVGHRFTRLVVLERMPNTMKNEINYLCKCDCGNTTQVKAFNLIAKSTKSCGCLRRRIKLNGSL